MGTSSDEQRRQRELQNARSQKSGYERERADKESTCRQNREKISRLKTVKSNLETQKAVAKGRYQSLKDYAESGSQFTEWTGDKRRTNSTARSYPATIPMWTGSMRSWTQSATRSPGWRMRICSSTGISCTWDL